MYIISVILNVLLIALLDESAHTYVGKSWVIEVFSEGIHESEFDKNKARIYIKDQM